MKKIVMILLGVSLLGVAEAAPKKSDKKQRTKTRKSKEVSFDELLVQGKHHFSDEAVVTVENDKILDALLEVRKNFKDRIKKSAKRN